MRHTTFAASAIRMDDGSPAVAIVAYPTGAAHAYSYLATPDEVREHAAQLVKAADDADARFGPLVTTEPEPGSPEDLAHWPPLELDAG